MAITERTLKKWRREALAFGDNTYESDMNRGMVPVNEVMSLYDRILRMTQELMDQYLLRKEVR